MKKILTAFFLSVALMFAGLLCLNVNAADVVYELVSDIRDLAVGDTIIIVNSSKNVALSTNQKKNNRGEVEVELDEGRVVSNPSIQEIVLKSGTETGTFAFNVGTDKYLYAASSSSNYLRTKSGVDANGSWAITIEANGVATIKAQGKNTRNLLKYNSDSYSGHIFSCYGSGQDNVSIMKKVETLPSFVTTDTKSSLIVTYDEELNPTDVDLRLGGIITADSYLAGATYGVLVTTATVNLTAGKTAYATVAEFIAENEGFKNVTCTPAQVETGYQFAWVITDMESNYNTSLTAVMYMVYDGALYICKSKTTSVKDTASQYITDAEKLRLTEEQVIVLEKLVALYGGNNNE